MTKSLYIAEKPSVAQEFAKALKQNMQRRDGYLESDQSVVTWCVGHLVTMSYPEKYDPALKRWSLETLPFLPENFKYEIIPEVKKQFTIVSNLLHREDIETIYVCTDSGREGEYIYRLVAQMAGIKDKKQKRVWIDSQTEEEILRGIREAKDESEYDNLSASAYLRAKEDYLMGINFSRLLSLKYGSAVASYLGTKYQSISVGRVMTCVLGMVVRREREIRSFVKTPFYRVIAGLSLNGRNFEGEWRAVKGSRYFNSPLLYKENGFQKKEDAQKLIEELSMQNPLIPHVLKMERKKENKNAPLLYNLAELQNDCARFFKISPDETLKVVQELYEKKLVTYPRTDARVLSSAVAREISKNLRGLQQYGICSGLANEILQGESWKKIGSTRYTNDKQITDHYAIIPTGQGLNNLRNLSELSAKVYETIVRRFLGIFYPPAVYQKVALVTEIGGEQFFSNFRVLVQEGYLKAMQYSFFRKKEEDDEGRKEDETTCDPSFLAALSQLQKGSELNLLGLSIKEGETSPPKRYTSGSMILAMENAGQLIEDEELREQMKDCALGTPATRAAIIERLISVGYVSRRGKNLTATEKGVHLIEAVPQEIASPETTGRWERALAEIARGSDGEQRFREGIARLAAFLVQNASGAPDVAFAPEERRGRTKRVPTLGVVCPLCGKGKVAENSKGFYCTRFREGCKFTIWKNELVRAGGPELTAKLLKLCMEKRDVRGSTGIIHYENGAVRFTPIR